MRADTGRDPVHNRGMINIAAQISNELDAIAAKQVPFAASLALNRTATGARDAVRANLPKRFRLRNTWTQRGIQARPSTKRNLMALLTAPGYMRIQEDGGIKHPSASRMLAGPTDELQTGRVIRKAMRPKALMHGGKGFILPTGNGGAGVFQRKRKQIRMLYALTAEQHYEERFHFEDDVHAHVGQNFSQNFADALAQAMR